MGLSLEKLQDILSSMASPGDLDYIPVTKLQLTAIDTVLRTATKVDENRLRKREQDIVPLVLARIAAFREKACHPQIHSGNSTSQTNNR